MDATLQLATAFGPWAVALLALAGVVYQWRSQRPKVTAEAALLLEQAEQIGITNLRDMLRDQADRNAAQAAENARLQGQLAELSAGIVKQAQLEQEAQARRHERDNELTRTLATLELKQRGHGKALADLQAQHERDLGAMRAEYQGQIDRLTAENARLHEELDAARAEIGRLRAAVDGAIAGD